MTKSAKLMREYAVGNVHSILRLSLMIIVTAKSKEKADRNTCSFRTRLLLGGKYYENKLKQEFF